MRTPRSTNANFLLAGALLVACGDDDGGDGSVIIGMDGSTPSMDGGDAQTADAARDAGEIKPADAGPRNFCSFNKSEFGIVSDFALSLSDPLAVAVRNDGASLSWIEYSGAASRLHSAHFSSEDSAVVSVESDGGTSTQVAPSNVTTDTGYLTVWSDDLGGFDLHAQGWTADGQPAAPMDLKLTSDGATTVERTPVIARGADGKMVVAWQNAQQTSGRSLLLDASGTPIGQPRTIENFGASSGQPALLALGNRYVLAWADGVKLRVHMVLLDATGAPLGSDVLVDVEQNAAGHVDLANSEQGGAIVFDVNVAGSRPEVRFHGFDANGALVGAERVVTNSPNTGTTPSIVSIAGGYVVAYRSVKSPDMQMQVVLLDTNGTPTGGNISVTPLYDVTSPVVLRIAPDGKHMFLSWLDRVAGSASAYNLQRTWVTCD